MIEVKDGEVQYMITGIGPVAADGSVELFTKLDKPIVVSGDWIANCSDAPQVGDKICYTIHGTSYLEQIRPTESKVTSHTEIEERPRMIVTSGVNMKAVMAESKTRKGLLSWIRRMLS